MEFCKLDVLDHLAVYAASYPESERDAAMFRSMKTTVDRSGGIGRWHVDHEVIGHRVFSKRPSLLMVHHEIRNALMPDEAVDIDVVNSMPTILEQLCLRHEIDTPHLRSFNLDHKRYGIFLTARTGTATPLG